jgi:hypothetical protein
MNLWQFLRPNCLPGTPCRSVPLRASFPQASKPAEGSVSKVFFIVGQMLFRDGGDANLIRGHRRRLSRAA